MPRILIVDDDDQVRTMLSKVLLQRGFQVSEAVNGLNISEKIQDQPADVVILDIVMPEREGLETLMEIKQKNPGQKIIAISGGDPNIPEYLGDSLKAAQVLGADHVLQKPFEHKLLLDCIKKLMKDDPFRRKV